MLIIGTSYFSSRRAALKYYRAYNPDAPTNRRIVNQKIKDGEIHIGKPTLKKGETAWLDEDDRWMIGS